MLAGQLTDRCRIELVEVPEPVLGSEPMPGSPGDILFQPEMSCLCGSDLPYFNGERPEMPTFPSPVGYSLHEMVGTVLATNGRKFRPGDKVLAVPVKQRGFYQRYVVSEARAIAWDPRLSAGKAVLAQPLGTVIFGLKKLATVLDKDVAIVGAGPIGQMFVAVLRNLGARNIYVIDKLASRLPLAKRLGATATVCNATENPVAAVADLTGGRMVDIVVEAVGHADQVLNMCIELSALNTPILSFGVPPETIELNYREMFYRNVSIHTTVNPDFDRDFPLAMRWIAENRIDLTPLVTHHYPLGEVQAAFDTFKERRDGAQKVLLEFPQ
jgi:threonine dehydrogenase-like Zn-dependent dehydrogenase